jgi:protein-tyrosine phosphatase
MVICHGNICRSPFAGAELAMRNGSLQVRSAGLEAGKGKPAEPFARRTARELGVDLTDHKAHRFDAEDIAWADLIVAMQGRHVASIRRRWPGAEKSVRLLGDFLPSKPHAIEDPWGQEAVVFSKVFQKIVQANERLSELLLSRGEKSNT